jgi:hypothetical protein
MEDYDVIGFTADQGGIIEWNVDELMKLVI